MDELKCATVILQAVLQVACTCAAIWVYSNRHLNGGRAFWLWFATGFSFQLARSVLYLLDLTNVPVPFSEEQLQIFTWIIVPTAVPVSYTIAMTLAIMYVRKLIRRLRESEAKYAALVKRLGASQSAV